MFEWLLSWVFAYEPWIAALSVAALCAYFVRRYNIYMFSQVETKVFVIMCRLSRGGALPQIPALRPNHPRIRLQFSESEDFPQEFAPLLALHKLLFFHEDVVPDLLRKFRFIGTIKTVFPGDYDHLLF